LHIFFFSHGCLMYTRFHILCQAHSLNIYMYIYIYTRLHILGKYTRLHIFQFRMSVSLSRAYALSHSVSSTLSTKKKQFTLAYTFFESTLAYRFFFPWVFACHERMHFHILCQAHSLEKKMYTRLHIFWKYTRLNIFFKFSWVSRVHALTHFLFFTFMRVSCTLSYTFSYICTCINDTWVSYVHSLTYFHMCICIYNTWVSYIHSLTHFLSLTLMRVSCTLSYTFSYVYMYIWHMRVFCTLSHTFFFSLMGVSCTLSYNFFFLTLMRVSHTLSYKVSYV